MVLEIGMILLIFFFLSIFKALLARVHTRFQPAIWHILKCNTITLNSLIPIAVPFVSPPHEKLNWDRWTIFSLSIKLWCSFHHDLWTSFDCGQHANTSPYTYLPLWLMCSFDSYDSASSTLMQKGLQLPILPVVLSDINWLGAVPYQLRRSWH